MKLLYSDFGSKIVNAEDIRKLRNDREQIAHYIDQAFNEEYFKVPSGISAEYKGRNLIIRQVMNTYVGNILAFDEKNVPFRIDTLEEKYTWPLELSGGKRKVWIGGIIDRIDFKNEVCRIIDYKTGKVGSEFKDPEETFSSDAGHSCDAIRQSFLYSLVVSKLKNYKKIQPSLFFVRSILQEDFDPRIINRSSGRIPVEDFSTLSADIENRLVEILSELYDPDVEFVQTEDENRCTYCLYRSICWRGPE